MWCTLYLILALLCSTRGVHGMMSTLRNRAYVTTQAIRRLPTNLYARFYSGSMYRTPASRQTVQQPRQAPSMMTQPSTRAFHATPTAQFSASTASPASPLGEFTRWIQGKPTANSMFTLFDQALKDGSTFDTLIKNITTGAYDDIINTTRLVKFFADNKDRKNPSAQLTILDQAISHLIGADKFGVRSHVDKNSHPNLTATDFFDIQTTPKLIHLIDILLQREAVIEWPRDFVSQAGEYYGLIKHGILPPKDPKKKQAFFDYIASLKRIANQINDKYKLYQPFENEFKFFESEGARYSSQERNDWIKGREDQIITDIKSGNYTAVLDSIKNGTIDDLVDKPYYSSSGDYFFAGPYQQFGSKDSLCLLEQVLQILLKTKTLKSPMDVQTKKWSDIFDPINDPQLIPIAQVLAEKSMISRNEEERTAELLAYVLFAEKFITPPTDPAIAQQYKQFLQAITDIAQRIFEKRVQRTRSNFYTGDYEDKFYDRMYAYKSSFHNFTEHVKQKFGMASGSSRQYSDQSQRQYQQPRPPSPSKREEALKILGFAPNTHPTEPEIQEKWRELIELNHPDKGGDLKKAQLINAARDALLNK
jgi:uncharacterized LabA/DUF88 family protein